MFTHPGSNEITGVQDSCCIFCLSSCSHDQAPRSEMYTTYSIFKGLRFRALNSIILIQNLDTLQKRKASLSAGVQGGLELMGKSAPKSYLVHVAVFRRYQAARDAYAERARLLQPIASNALAVPPGVCSLGFNPLNPIPLQNNIRFWGIRGQGGTAYRAQYLHA